MASNPYKKTPFPEFEKLNSLSKKQAEKEIRQLRDAINYHDHRYYIKNDPVISDKAYDTLLHRLEEIEDKYPDLKTETSPTQKVGAPPVDKLKKKEHKAIMLSLNSSDKEKKIREFIDSVKKLTGLKKPELVLEPKLDGLSVEVYYENGRFSYATTRGDGKTGEDISENVKTISSLPLQLRNNDYPNSIAFRGEIFMPLDAFRKINKEKIEKNEDPFANARNAAAGIVRQLDSKKVAKMPLDIFFYEIMASNEDGVKSHYEMLKKLPEWGLKTNTIVEKCDSFKKIKSYYSDLSKKRDELSFEIDGIVIKLNDRKLREKAGIRERSPRWAYAWKFTPKKEKTILRDIVIQVGRTGTLTPVALFDPVDVGGVTVSRATLHNEEEVKKKDVRTGDKVLIQRAGDVIPEVVKRVEKAGKGRGKAFEMPSKCPVCNTKIKKEGAYNICPAGLACEAQLKGTLSHFVSKGAMNIENMGEKNISMLVDEGMVKSIADIYKLKKPDIMKLEGFGEKSAEKLIDAIRNSRNPALSDFIYALGIRHTGKHIALLLAGHFHSLKNIRKASFREIRSIHEIGDEIAESIINFFDAEKNQKMLDELQDLGVRVKTEKGKKSDQLSGKTFVITGKLERYSRDEIKEKIETLGGNATSSISSNTDYLIVGEDPGSKLDDAKENNVQIINEDEFNKMIESKNKK